MMNREENLGISIADDRTIFKAKRSIKIKDASELCWLASSDPVIAQRFIETWGIEGVVRMPKAAARSMGMQHLIHTDVIDHIHIFKRKNGEIILVTMPYRCKGALQAAERWADRHGLFVKEFKEMSWHYPGETTLFVFRQKLCRTCIFRSEEDVGEWYCCSHGFEHDNVIYPNMPGCKDWKGNFEGMVH